MTRRLLPGLLMAVLTLGWVGAVPQAAAATSTCSGVWVVVDFGSLGSTSTECATSYGTGTAALRSAGLPPTLDSAMIVKVGGLPSNPDLNKAYWSYWHATRKSDGSYSGWSYSTLGANGYHPSKGNAEGWHYQSLSGGNVPPAARPPAAEAPKPTPKPTPTPTRTSKPSATAKPTATRKPTARASSASTSATARPSIATSTTPTPVLPTPTPTVTPTDAQTIEASELGQQTTSSQRPAGGSPVGALIAGGLVVAGAAGIGGWWWLRGRKR
ncbi:MAG: hypothetical protein ACOH1Y_05315 [Propionicimonas sp.]